jgi:DNA-binding transcriptional ArsR family regulator
MKIEDIYTCLSDPVRIRIVNLLSDGPLCGCMIKEIVGVSQVKVSKQLAYLKKLGAVDSRREANWVMYFLSEPVPPLLEGNLRLLRLKGSGMPDFETDLKERKKLVEKLAKGEREAPRPVKEHCCKHGRILKRSHGIF